MTSKIFEEAYLKLNKKQKEAVDTIDGPVMVIAGPGTGKTTILTLRIANILRLTDVGASGVLALTFTEAGVKTMKDKLRQIIGSEASEVGIFTFHGFAKSIIDEFGEYFPHLKNKEQINDIESEDLLRKILKQKEFVSLRPLGEPDYYIPKIISAVSESKKEAWTGEMIKSFAIDEIEKIQKDPDSISSRGKTKGMLKGEAKLRIERCKKTLVFGDVYIQFEKEKRDAGKIDFDDLIFELIRALKQEEVLLRIVQEKYLYILVDEHQDTNDSQNTIVSLVSDFFDTPNLFVVGDEKQAIYRFQGASVQNFLNFQKKWQKMKIISLKTNYRSHQSILDATYKMIQKNYLKNGNVDLNTKLTSENKNKKRPIDIIATEDRGTENHILVESIRSIVDQSNDSIAVIVRKNKEVAEIFSILKESELEVEAEISVNIFSHPIGILFFSILEYINDSTKTEALAKTVVHGLWGLEFSKQNEIIKSIKSGGNLELEKEIKELGILKSELALSSALNYLLMIGNLSGLVNTSSKTVSGISIWRVIYSLAEQIVKSKNILSADSLIEELLSIKKSAERRNIKIKSGNTDCQIKVMTAHSSKGLEFDYVFLPMATKNSWVNGKNHSSFILPKEKYRDEPLQDDRRLFYVSLTRAKKHATILWSEYDYSNKPNEKLIFLDELDQDFTKSTNIKSVETEKYLTKNTPNLTEERLRELENFAKNHILENGISVTALNHFLKCPSQFLYKSILKLPEAPNPLSIKGNAMHEALASVWVYKKTLGKNESLTKEKIESIIKVKALDYIKKSFLATFEKEALFQEIDNDTPRVALELFGHFQEDGNVFIEKWFEKSLTYKFGNKIINFRLHGKLDTLIDKSDKVSVYDYKTKEAMSPNAVRGETQSEDGSYFRQLIFYRILLESQTHFKTKSIETALVFIKPNKSGKCPIVFIQVTSEDTKRVLKEVESLIFSVWSGELFREKCDELECEYCKMKAFLF